MSQSVDVAALVERGVDAYRDRDFETSISSLLQALDMEPRNWRAKLYLAMSYFRAGQIFTANAHFRFLKENCPDADIRQKAESAIAAMGTSTKVMPQMTVEIRKPVAPEPDEDGAELEWVPENNRHESKT